MLKFFKSFFWEADFFKLFSGRPIHWVKYIYIYIYIYIQQIFSYKRNLNFAVKINKFIRDFTKD